MKQLFLIGLNHLNATQSNILAHHQSSHVIFGAVICDASEANLVLKRLSKRYFADSQVSSSELGGVAVCKLGKFQQTSFSPVTTAAPADTTQRFNTCWKTLVTVYHMHIYTLWETAFITVNYITMHVLSIWVYTTYIEMVSVNKDETCSKEHVSSCVITKIWVKILIIAC